MPRHHDPFHLAPEKRPVVFRKLMTTVRNIQDVVNWRLCTGCGACSYACPTQNVQLVDVVGEGIRPRWRTSCGTCCECLEICSGLDGSGGVAEEDESTAMAGESVFGRVLEIWEGHAADPEIRFRGSSGGALSALALYCLEQEGMGQVLHTAADPEIAWCNRTVVSTSRGEVLSGSGSRYAPSSPCEGLAALEAGASPGVMIGKPCDAAAVARLRAKRPALDGKVGLVLTFFCAGVPATQGTLDLMALLGVQREEVSTVRYRGLGWPGSFELRQINGRQGALMSYSESWARLAPYRSLRCKLCADGAGEAADIACGDAWRHDRGDGENSGMSLLLVRTGRGREILRRAMAAGYLVATRVSAEAAAASQGNLLDKRRELHGRLAVMRMLRIPAPRFPGFALVSSWRSLPLARRLRVMAGTLRRIWRHGWWKPEASVAPVGMDAVNPDASVSGPAHAVPEMPVAQRSGAVRGGGAP